MAGGSKKKTGGPSRMSSQYKLQKKTAEGGEHAAELAGAAHTVILPTAARRAQVAAARRTGERAGAALAERTARRAAELAARPVNGTVGGAVLGGGGSLLPERQARLQHLARQQAEARVEQREKAAAARAARNAPYVAKQEHAAVRFSTQQAREQRASAAAVSELPAVRDARAARLGSSAGSSAGGGEVGGLLDALAGRLGADAVRQSHGLLITVLGNAATRADPKFRRVKARNEKLWTGLLQHPEAVAVLAAAAVGETVILLSPSPHIHPH